MSNTIDNNTIDGSLPPSATQAYSNDRDRVIICFERHIDAPLRWYNFIYKRAVEWLQGSPMTYSHVFVLVYDSSGDDWFMLEVKYVLGEHDNGIQIGTLIDEVVIIPSDRPSHPNVGLISPEDDSDLLLYSGIEVANPGPVCNILLGASLLQETKSVTTCDFIELLFTGQCEAFVCTDFVTTLLRCNLDFVTTPDILYGLATHILT